MKLVVDENCPNCLDPNVSDCGLHPQPKFEFNVGKQNDAIILQDNKPLVIRKPCGCWVLPCNEHQ